MADRFWVAGGDGNWSNVNNWSASTGGASGASAPGATNSQGDKAVFDLNSGSGTATVDASVPTGDTALTELTSSTFTGTLALGANDIDIDGPLTLAATTTGTGTIFVEGAVTIRPATSIASTVVIEWNGGGAADLTMTNAGSPLGALTVNGTGTLTVVDATTSNLRVAGHLTYTAGTFDTATNSVKVTHSGTSNVSWNTTPNKLDHYEAASGAAITLTGNLICCRFTALGTATLTGTNDIILNIPNGATNVWAHGGGQIDVDSVIFKAGADDAATRTIEALDLPDVAVDVQVGAGLEIRAALGGNWAIGATSGANLIVQEATDDEFGQLDCAGFDLLVGGDVILGRTGANTGGGVLLLGSGRHVFKGDVKKNTDNNAAAPGANGLQFETCLIRLGGTLDGSDIVLTSSEAAIEGGIIQETADQGLIGTLYALTSRDGGNNDPDVIFGLGGNLTGTGTRTTRLFGPAL